MVVVVVLGVTVAADAKVPLGPFGASQSRTSRVSEPPCSITQAWQKKPGALTVESIAFTGRISCSWVPSNLELDVEILVFDQTAATLRGSSIDTSSRMGPSSTPETLTLTSVWNGPKVGHTFTYELIVSFVENDYNYVHGVRGYPPQWCQDTSDLNQGFSAPSVDCDFTQVITVL